MLPVLGSLGWSGEESVTHNRGEQTVPSKAAINAPSQEQLGNPFAKNSSISGSACDFAGTHTSPVAQGC